LEWEKTVYESREQRNQIQEWVDSLPECPTRKQAKKKFPGMDQRHIRAAIQSRKDRETLGQL